MAYRNMALWSSWVLLWSILAVHAAAENFATSCEYLKTHLHLDKTKIISATHISAPSNVSTPGTCQTKAFVSTPICRVQFVINTSPSSSVYAEAWLPLTWYGRLLGIGNGGLGGCVDYEDLDYGSSYHFATISTNNGHDGDNGLSFLKKPQVINDFGHRAIHVAAVVGKEIVKAYYGRRHNKAYFMGCSSGGRQAHQEALKYPEDFDGIIAGAPATNWNHLMGWFAILARFVGAPDPQRSANFIPLPLWNVVSAEILKQCDELDGVKDGIITDPDECQFRPEAIVCTGNSTNDCLSPPQIDALRQIYQPLFGLSGELLYPRYDPGAEADGNAVYVFNGSVVAFARDWYRYAVLSDPKYDFRDFGRKHIALADKINPGGISTFDGNLASYKKRGGKFLVYQGRSDQLVPAGNAKRLYNLISKTLHLPSLDDFYRVFFVPGMNHCYGGRGATRFGQLGPGLGQLRQGLLTVNASSHNILLAMVNWVENGTAPDTIIGTSAAGEERAHCRYPHKSVWNGTSFLCQ